MVALLKKSKRTCQKCGGPIMGKHARLFCGVVCAGTAVKTGKCAECGISFRSKGKAKFCSRSCSGRFNGRKSQYTHSEETKQKIRASNHENKVKEAVKNGRLFQNGKLLSRKGCVSCGQEFLASRKTTKTCSVSCLEALKDRLKHENKDRQRSNGRKVIERLMREGRWKGWSGRSEPSYPEKYIAQILSEKSLVFEKEYQVSRFSIDFAFPSKKIALEVDGKQHQYPAQKRHDQSRDEFLRKKGWTVFRLEWKSIRTEEGRQRVHDQFEKFMELMLTS